LKSIALRAHHHTGAACLEAFWRFRSHLPIVEYLRHRQASSSEAEVDLFLTQAAFYVVLSAD
jgi:hypothetical protein